jgi:biopolymer transport protein ExbD
MNRLPRRELPVIPTANLVDIAILLIIFYMACSNFVSHSAISLKPPRAADLKKMKESLILVSVDDKNRIYLQGRLVSSAEDIEWGVAALVKDKLTQDGRTVMFKCDQAVSREVFEPVLEAIAKGGGLIAAIGENVKLNQSDEIRETNHE